MAEVDLTRPEFNPTRLEMSEYTTEQLIDLRDYMIGLNEKRYKETGKESESFCHQITVIKIELHAREDDIKYKTNG